MCELPAEERISLDKISERKNREYGTNYKRTNILMKFRVIEESGLRQPKPDRRYRPDKGKIIPAHYFDIMHEYDEIRLGYRQRGEKPPLRDRILEEIGKKYGLSVKTTADYISRARMAINKAKKMKE